MSEHNYIFDTVATIIADQLGIEKSQVKLTSSFDDLGMDSVDQVEVIMKLEEALNIEIKDENAESFKTVQDAVHYLEKLVKQ